MWINWKKVDKMGLMVYNGNVDKSTEMVLKVNKYVRKTREE